MACLGDPDGLAETMRGIDLLIDQGAGRDAAALHNNLAVAGIPLQGPERSLAVVEEAIRFSEQRGLVEMATGSASNRLWLLVELGRTDEALACTAELLTAAENDTPSLIDSPRENCSQIPGGADFCPPPPDRVEPSSSD